MTSSLNLNPMNTAVDFDPFAGGEILVTALATESQKEIWASVQLGDDANCAYNESVSLKFQGLLNLEALQSAFQELVQRHESLRTTFSPDGTSLCVTESPQIELPYQDWSHLSVSEQLDKIATLKHQVVSTPFDLEQGPLFRIDLVKLQPEEHFLILTAHHIVFDGWSWGVIIPELGKCYAAFYQGETPELDDPDHFSDYALMLEEAEESSETIATETYWLEQFSGTIPIVDFPTDYPRPAFRTFDSAREDVEISVELVSALKKLGTSAGCSFMTVLLSGFEVFLHRLTGQDDLVVGISAAGQAASGLYNLVGHCVNLLPLRTQLNPDQSFRDYLNLRRSQVLDAYDHQQFTFGRLLQKLSLPRDPSRIPLVPITFNIDQGLDTSQLPFPGLTVDCASNPRTYENFELYLNATELAGKLILECQYNTNLFEPETIRRRLAEFETLLTGITANPDHSIKTLPLLPAAEQQQLAAWNLHQADLPQLCIHQRFEAQVEKNPDAIALTYEDQTLTYGELNQRANQLAHYLKSLGVGADVLVGLCLERSLDLIVGILGILKAGGAYVPLDSAYPVERLAFIVEDAAVQVLVSQNSCLEKFADLTLHTVCFDRDVALLEQQSSANLHTEITASHLAYVIYTSGSTGQPKGVLIPHANVIRLFESTQPWFQFSDRDVWTLFHSFAFDFSVWEIWGALLYGGKLVIVPYVVTRSTEDFYRLLSQQQVTILNQTPSAFNQLIKTEEMTPQPKPLNLRFVIFGGEALDLQTLQPWFDRHSDQSPQLVNMYGITETTVHVTYRPITSADLTTKASIIGRPIPDLHLYLLDQHQQPVPIGIPGEIYVGGLGLARGYLNRPELTAERFIANPFSASDRLYRSGDLARYLPNGDLEYLGRIDHQIKLRGFRIELGEIEVVIRHHALVREAVVVVRKETPDDVRLIAYIVPKAGAELSTSDLLNSLKQTLPDFMVPAAFVLLDQMPLTTNGKIDLKALPAPSTSRPELASTYIAPRTPSEEKIAATWSEILKLDQIGIYDNFFDLGGYSLLGTQVLIRLRQQFAIEIPLRALFEAPTIAGLADRIETLRWLTQGESTLQIAASDDYEEGEL